MPDPAASPLPVRIGPYELGTPLGSGGAGTVYRARDTRTGREVALKRLRLDRPGHAGQPARLLAEARAAGRLRHPHVMVVLDVGTADDEPYFVTELVDGASLRAELDRPLLVRRALDLAVQIADGLAAAHQGGIVHRDLKPENVMVSRHGQVTVVDFGLAKALEPGDGSGTGASTLTAPHAVLGTVNYMSPEQARGEPVDARSDQFSFGVVLYEMLTGRRAFSRATTVETLAAIIKEDPPPLASLRADVPVPVQWIVARCLAKSPDGRYAATADLLYDLRVAIARSDELARTATARPWRAWATAAALLMASIGGSVWLAARRDAQPVTPLPVWRRLSFEQGFVNAARFMRDGETVLYSAAWLNRPFAIFSTTLSRPESRPLEVPAAGLLAVAPDGEVALSQDCTFVSATGACAGTLARVPFMGGAARPIADAVRSADWGPGGALAITRGIGREGLSVEYPIGTRISDRGDSYIRISPDGTRVAWVEALSEGLKGVMVREAGRVSVVTDGWSFISGLAWAPGGEALLVTGVGHDSTDDAVVRVRLDGARDLALRGLARLRVLDAASQDRLLVSVSTTSARLLLWSAGSSAARDLTWLDNAYLDAIDPDGRRVLFTVRAGASLEFERTMYPIYLRDAAGGPATRIGTGYGVALSADGRWALTRSRPDTTPADLVLTPLGPGEPRVLPRGDVDIGSANSLATFLDGSHLILRGREGAGPWRTYVQALEGGPPTVVAHEPGELVAPAAPDGDRFIARRSDGSLWVARVSSPAATRLPGDLDTSARILQWTADGRGIVVARGAGLQWSIDRLDLATGRLTRIRTVTPSASAGVESFRGLAASLDGTTIGVSEVRTLGTLYLVSDGRP